MRDPTSCSNSTPRPPIIPVSDDLKVVQSEPKSVTTVKACSSMSTDTFNEPSVYVPWKNGMRKNTGCLPSTGCDVQVFAIPGCSIGNTGRRRLSAGSEIATQFINDEPNPDIQNSVTTLAANPAAFKAATEEAMVEAVKVEPTATIDTSNIPVPTVQDNVRVTMIVAPPPPSTPPAYPPGGPGQILRDRPWGKTWGDPHLSFANGGSADFRGLDHHIFNFVSAPNFTVNVMTIATNFVRWGGQIVHGSFITKLFVKMRSPRTGAVIRAALHADQYASFRTFATDDASKYENHTRSQLDGLEVLQLSGGRFVAHGAGWEVFVNRRRLRKPLVAGSKNVAPVGDSSRWFLDISFNVLDDRKDDSAKFGRSTLGRTAPHGIVGQSFDGSLIAVSGKQDKYGDAPEFTTTAQAEGAIEGVFTEYVVPAPFTTSFRYSRFDAKGVVAPRNVTTLMGVKTAGVKGTSAGSTELYGVE